MKAILAKEFHIQPSEIDSMPAWEYELFVKEIDNAVKEENERHEKEMESSGMNKAKKMTDPNNIRRMQQSSMNNMPKMPNMSNLSNFKMPKL